MMAGLEPDRTGIDDSEESRRFNLECCLDLVDRYEMDQMRSRTWNPIHRRTPGEILRECDEYRRESSGTSGFSYPGHDSSAPRRTMKIGPLGKIGLDIPAFRLLPIPETIQP